MARTQRVEKLLKEFMQYHNAGYTVLEIAKIFEVDFSTVYNYLQEIADANGVTRESLLERKSSQHGSIHSVFLKEKIDAKNLLADFEIVEKDLSQVIAKIDKILSTNQ